MIFHSAPALSFLFLADIRAGPEATCLDCITHQPSLTTHTNHMSPDPTRLFAVDPAHKGFGYAVFELPFQLVEFGFAIVEGDKHAGAIARCKELIDRFRPDALVIEDAAAPGARRYPRVRRLLESITTLAEGRGIQVRPIARTEVIKCFSPLDGPRATKYRIAERLAEQFPELLPKLPKPRKIWETENDKLAIFDALSLAVTHAME